MRYFRGIFSLRRRVHILRNAKGQRFSPRFEMLQSGSMEVNMKNRDKWITIIFLMLILVIPSVSLVRNFLPSYKQDQGLTEAEKEVLKNNGTMREDEETIDNNNDDNETSLPNDKKKETLFTRLQNNINNFTEGLFGRTKLIAFNTKLTSLLTGGTYIESTQVLMGKNGMFFYKTELDGHPIWDYMGINHFSETELSVMAANLTATKEHLAQKGIEFYAMCIPNKEIVYDENMPDTIARVNEESRGEQLANYINENTDVIFVYPKDALIANKDKAQLYYFTDTHANQIGAFVGIQALFKEVYGTEADLDSVKFIKMPEDYSGDLVTIAGLAGEYVDENYAFDKGSIDPEQYHDQVLLFVGDSFGGYLSVICKGYYEKVYWEHPDAFKYSMYEKYNPDVVIWERAERHCERFMDPLLTTP